MAASVNTCARGFVASGLGIVLLGFGCSDKRIAEAPAFRELPNVVEEVMSVGEFSSSPVPNHAVSRLAYIRAGAQGNALWEMDLPVGRARRLARPEQALRLFDWSADDRYLLLRDLDNDDVLTLYDASEGSFRPAMPVENPEGRRVRWASNAGQVTWLGPNAFAYVANRDATPELRVATLDGQEKRLATVSRRRAQHLLPRLSEAEFGFVSEQELWSFNLAAGQASQLTTNLSKDYLWLNYSKENAAFLYCSEDDSEWRHLYRLDHGPPGWRKLTQLTFGPEHTYNGQWIQGGTGFAYVGNLTNHFYLAVRPSEVQRGTNLFWGGYVNSYKVAEDGNRIFAVASVGPEPSGLWEYDIATRRLRCLVPGAEPFKVSRIIPATEHWAKSFDALEIPYFRLEPRNFDPRKKYPLVIAVPHQIGTFDWAWSKYPQFLANIGVLHLAVNVRGTGGHGRAFRENHPEWADRDVLAVREAVVRSGIVDDRRIFLMSLSGGADMVHKLTAAHPGLWAGAILINPVLSVPKDKLVKPPRYLILTGQNDTRGDVAARAHEFEKWARANGVPATMLYAERTRHDILDVNVDKQMGFAMAEFIFERKYGGALAVRPQNH